ncbi:MAG: F0F1 ATP synthase subunit epsilon [Actinomycetaceae bacterium]|nr:F0F1 ATP synthase subunit epsilon [Actinomycetaceae bacterium]
MADKGMLQVEVVTRTEKLWHGLASSVVVPAVNGDLGILYNRAPILAVLKSGNATVDTGSERHQFQVSGGFVSVDSNFVTIVVESGEMTA